MECPKGSFLSRLWFGTGHSTYLLAEAGRNVVSFQSCFKKHDGIYRVIEKSRYRCFHLLFTHTHTHTHLQVIHATLDLCVSLLSHPVYT
jgi:hypothetical protein